MQKKSSERYPLEIKRGSSVVKIYRGRNRGKPFFTVVFVDSTGRKRETFMDAAKAKEVATARAESLAKGDHQALNITGDEARIYMAARDALAPLGVSVDVAAREYAEVWKIVGGSFIEAARHFKRTVLTGLPNKTVAEAVAQYIETKRGMSDLYLKDLRVLLAGRFAGAFNCQMRDVSADALRAFLNGLGVGPVAWNNNLRLVKGVFRHARKQNWLDRSHDTAADAIEEMEEPTPAVEIYTPEEMASLLAQADDDFRVWILMIAFCGVRREEVPRLTWADVEFNEGRVVLSKDQSKNGKEREIYFQPNVAQWLSVYRGRTGRLWTIDPRKRMAKLTEKTGIEWKKNGLRHSYGSYRFAQCKSPEVVAYEMGNSRKMVLDHYKRRLSGNAAERYWKLSRKTIVGDVKKVLKFAA